VLYPVKRGPASRQPADQIPTLQQLLQIRRYADGFLDPRPKVGDAELNQAIQAACSCPQEQGGWAPGCLIHGWNRIKEAQQRMQPEIWGAPPERPWWLPPERSEERRVGKEGNGHRT